MAKEKEIGVIDHFFDKIMVAGVTLSSTLKVGDSIHIAGHTTDVTVAVDSLQIDKEPVESAKSGESVGLKVSEKVRKGDKVFLVE